MDPDRSGLSLHRNVPVGFLWPPLSLFRQSRQPAAKTSLPAGSESQLSHTECIMYRENYTFILVLAKKMIFSLIWTGDIHLKSKTSVHLSSPFAFVVKKNMFFVTGTLSPHIFLFRNKHSDFTPPPAFLNHGAPLRVKHAEGN